MLADEGYFGLRACSMKGFTVANNLAGLKAHRSDGPAGRLFDEAQRAWDAKRLANVMSQKKGRTNFQMSEPGFLISVMGRHQDPNDATRVFHS